MKTHQVGLIEIIKVKQSRSSIMFINFCLSIHPQYKTHLFGELGMSIWKIVSLNIVLIYFNPISVNFS